MSSRLVAFASALLLAVAGAALPQSSAQAADEIVLKYRLLERSVDVADLERFAETGELTRPLRRYIRVSGQRPEQVRETLTQEFAVSPRLLDRMLNNPIGEAALNQISEAIYPPSGQVNETALRSALVLSASDDSRVSIIEVVRNYPTPQVYIDSERLIAAYGQIQVLSNRVGPLLEGLGL